MSKNNKNKLGKMAAEKADGSGLTITITDHDTDRSITASMDIMEFGGNWIPEGLPREQYSRVYVLLPPGVGKRWATTAIAETFDKQWTVGYSADDAGTGALENKTVVAINPGAWPTDLGEFFTLFYPNVSLLTVEAVDIATLKVSLRELVSSFSFS